MASSYTLDTAAAELRDKLTGTKIDVPNGKGIIVYKNVVRPVDPFTSVKDCKKMLRKLIKIANQERISETQAKLL